MSQNLCQKTGNYRSDTNGLSKTFKCLQDKFQEIRKCQIIQRLHTPGVSLQEYVFSPFILVEIHKNICAVFIVRMIYLQTRNNTMKIQNFVLYLKIYFGDF